MLDLLRRLFSPKSTDKSLLARFKRAKYRCPDCGGSLLMGPEGGCAVNMKCDRCNHEFNVGFAFDEVFSIERIRWSGPPEEPPSR